MNLETLTVPRRDVIAIEASRSPMITFRIDPENVAPINAHLQEVAKCRKGTMRESEKEPVFGHPPDPDEAAFKNAVPTLAEHKLLYLLSTGLTNVEIAKENETSDQTVKNQLSRLFKKTRVKSRLDLIHCSIESGYVEPLLLTTNADLSLPFTLSPREKHVYDLLCEESAFENKQLAEKLFITEDTTKNHLNSIVRKLQLGPNRTEIYMVELKRQDEMLDPEREISPLSSAFLTALMGTDQSRPQFRDYRLQPLGVVPKPSQYDRIPKGYTQMGVINLVEYNALGFLRGMGDLEKFASLKVRDRVSQLSDEDRTFLLRSNKHPDGAPLVYLADRENLGVDDYNKKVAHTLDTYGLSSFYQARVLVEYKRMLDAQKKLQERKKILKIRSENMAQHQIFP